MKAEIFEKNGFTLLEKGLKFIYLLTVMFCLAVAVATAQDGTVIWEQSYAYGAGGVADFGPSEKWDAANVNSELADDFDLTGTVTRVDMVSIV